MNHIIPFKPEYKDYIGNYMINIVGLAPVIAPILKPCSEQRYIMYVHKKSTLKIYNVQNTSTLKMY